MLPRLRQIIFALVAALPLLITGCTASISIGQQPAPGSGTLPNDEWVHQVLLRHPEWSKAATIDTASAEAAARRAIDEKAQKTVADLREALYHAPGDPEAGAGAGEADVTIVEFFDYLCPYCKSERTELEALLAMDHKVRVVYKMMPIFGPPSIQAAKAALAAQRQGKFAEFHKRLLSAVLPGPHMLPDDQIFQIAQASGLDLDRMKKDMADPTITAPISASIDLVTKLQLDATPVLIVGDKVNIGGLPLATLQQQVAAARAGSAI
jgi:protein-disulfide isomerase